MYNDITKPAPPLPSPELTEVKPGVSLLRPLSRRGTGPGIIILTGDHPDPLAINEGVPSPMIKWAEEGYTVVEIQAKALSGGQDSLLDLAVQQLAGCEKCEPKDKVGLVCRFNSLLFPSRTFSKLTCVLAYEPESWNAVASTISSHASITAAAVYADAPGDGNKSLKEVSIPVIYHFAGKTATPPTKSDKAKQYFYPNVATYKFATPFQDSFHYNTENISHTRNLTLLKEKMGGPYFDLETIWDEHTYYEFADRSMEHTMSTMVQEPYVNHVPTVSLFLHLNEAE